MENENNFLTNSEIKNSIDCFQQAIRFSNNGNFRASCQNLRDSMTFNDNSRKEQNSILRGSSNIFNKNLRSTNNYNSHNNNGVELRGSGSMALINDNRIIINNNNTDYFSDINALSSLDNIQQIQEEVEFVSFKQVHTAEYSYIGEMEFNERVGYGVCIYSSGAKYQGQWKANKQNGIGKLTLSTGATYEGEFKNNRPDGYVIYTDKEGYIIEGYIKNFIYPINSNLIIINTGNKQIFEMIITNPIDTKNFSSNLINGLGKITNKEKFIYQGYIKNSYQDSLGIFTKDRSIIQGTKKNREYNGYLEILYKDGTQFAGMFKNNKKEGVGLFIQPGLINISTYTQNFKNGASITRKFDNAINREIFAYENFHYGFKTLRMDNPKEQIENYLLNFYPEQRFLINFDFSKVAQILQG